MYMYIHCTCVYMHVYIQHACIMNIMHAVLVSRRRDWYKYLSPMYLFVVESPTKLFLCVLFDMLIEFICKGESIKISISLGRRGRV